MTIADNVRAIREKMAEAAVRSGRDPKEIRLVAAAKMHDAAAVREAIAAGVDAVGENRVQELLEKRAQGAYAGAPLHFIGTLQTNKIRQLVGVCDMIESVDSERQIEMIGKRAGALGIVQDVLIEVNIGREPGKSGVAPEALDELLAKAGETPGVRVLGLMAIPPFTANPADSRPYFDAMYQLFIDMSAKKYDNIFMHFLSMGMSDSFSEAIKAGANMVRIGTAIFGARRY
ncbi:MAG: YggS family pyridoxal phosphate-dependent enzyme [Clostridiales bacterium]|nr:YggS family pyridoxal phosphate-dependent enzyme [Clostridiales bacterium]